MFAVSLAQIAEFWSYSAHLLRLSKLCPSSRYQHANTADTSSVIYSTDMDVEVSGTPNTRQARS